MGEERQGEEKRADARRRDETRLKCTFSITSWEEKRKLSKRQKREEESKKERELEGIEGEGVGMDYRKQGGGGGGRPGGPNLTGYDTSKLLYGSGKYERSGSGQMGSNSSHFYPRIAQPVGPATNRAPAPVPHSSPTSGTGIKVAIKPEYRVAPAVELILPQNADVPRSLFTFDFELERKILAEAERESQGWDSGRANGDASSAPGRGEDQVVAKYIGMGLNREAVVFAVATFGDVQSKVVDFVSSYNLLREMGFPSTAVTGALAMYDNDRERALAHFV